MCPCSPSTAATPLASQFSNDTSSQPESTRRFGELATAALAHVARITAHRRTPWMFHMSRQREMPVVTYTCVCAYTCVQVFLPYAVSAKVVASENFENYHCIDLSLTRFPVGSEVSTRSA